MKTGLTLGVALVAFLLAIICTAPRVFGNGGPFVVKHPNGDPAAKGVLARLDPTLKPAQETRLRVLKEDLTIRFVPESGYRSENSKLPPAVEVSAAYRIENPTDQEVQEDFGFPILRGIYLRWGMLPYPDVRVQADKDWVSSTVISNSAIYGMIRRDAREAIEKGIAADPELARFTAGIRAAWIVPKPPNQKAAQQRGHSGDLDIPIRGNTGMAIPHGDRTAEQRLARKPSADYRPTREKLREYLTTKLRWSARDAALMIEYVSLDLGTMRSMVRDRWDNHVYLEKSLADLKAGNLGSLAAVGEQKATQLFAQLASRFDKDAGSAYEAIFTAWGGDVRERSVDLETGVARPRELTLPAAATASEDHRLTADPTVYARVDYLDPKVKISNEEKESCEAIVKNLPVTFTFAPMNLLHYQVKFAPHSTRTVTVSYRQYAYADTLGAGSYQLAYVLHPATLWKEFGPINVTLQVPKGIACKASAGMEYKGDNPVKPGLAANDADRAAPVSPPPSTAPYRADVYQTTLADPQEKQGELFIAVDKAAWDKMFPPTKPKPVQQAAPSQPPAATQR